MNYWRGKDERNFYCGRKKQKQFKNESDSLGVRRYAWGGGKMPLSRFSAIVTVSCFLLLFLNLPFSAGQDLAAVNTTPDAERDAGSVTPYKVSVDVREIRLDVVVVDNKGRQITDLTADDFEVYQDKREQEVTSGIYISNQTDPAAWPSSPGKVSPNLPQLPAAPLKKEEVHRSIVFLLDNVSMTPLDMYYAKMGVNRFLEKQMLPGDLVSVMFTGSGNSAFNMFSSDKRMILWAF